MSCETWNVLASQGERLLREGSEERVAAERHFASCRSCAEQAFLLDPAWAVRRTIQQEPTGFLKAIEKPGLGNREAADLERRVLEAGRLRDLEGSVRREPTALRVAIAAGVLAGLVAGGALLRTTESFRREAGSESAEADAVAISPAAARDPLPFSDPAVQLSLPTIGSLAPASARIYDLGQEDFALVMVVHETLDL